MGKQVANVALAEFEIVGGLEAKGHPAVGKTVREVCGVRSQAPVVGNPEELPICDVVVDFSTPEGTLRVLRWAEGEGKPVVSGTTGFTPEQFEVLKSASSKIPVLWSSNMSFGMNFIFSILPEFVKKLKDFDVEILEVHHRRKKDAPSGTALKLAQIISGERRVNIIFGREGATGPRPSDVLGVLGVRGGDVVGDHTIMFLGNGERIELVHRATSREAFARGAIIAAKFVIGKAPRLYSMLDIFRSA